MGTVWTDPSLWLGVYGAVLSTLLGAREIVKSRRSVKVSGAWAMFPSPTGKPVRAYAITAVNQSHRPVTVTMGGLFTRGQKQVIQPAPRFFGKWPLPKRLEDGDAVTLYMELDELRRAILEEGKGDKLVSSYVKDADGKRYTHKLPSDFEEQVMRADD